MTVWQCQFKPEIKSQVTRVFRSSPSRLRLTLMNDSFEQSDDFSNEENAYRERDSILGDDWLMLSCLDGPREALSKRDLMHAGNFSTSATVIFWRLGRSAAVMTRGHGRRTTSLSAGKMKCQRPNLRIHDAECLDLGGVFLDTQEQRTLKSRRRPTRALHCSVLHLKFGSGNLADVLSQQAWDVAPRLG
jgi:hypothetical protein